MIKSRITCEQTINVCSYFCFFAAINITHKGWGMSMTLFNQNLEKTVITTCW